MKICKICSLGPCEIKNSVGEHIAKGARGLYIVIPSILSYVPEVFINGKKYDNGLALCPTSEWAESDSVRQVSEILKNGCRDKIKS